jgi:molybdate transport system substrate-binding protein
LIRLLTIFVFLTTLTFANTINIAVASNVSYAVPTLKKEFNKVHPAIDVRIILGSSGKLSVQIEHGAPYDIFMSANMKYPNNLYENKTAVTKPIVYAQGTLALLSNNQRSFKHGINLLQSKLVKRIAIGNPKTAPYGVATVEALRNANILNDITNKLIYAESISQTVSYTMIAADVGIVAKSSLYSPKLIKFHKYVHWIEVDESLYTPINQGIVILKKAKSDKNVKAFYDFILSNKGQNILKDFGYTIP